MSLSNYIIIRSHLDFFGLLRFLSGLVMTCMSFLSSSDVSLLLFPYLYALRCLILAKCCSLLFSLIFSCSLYLSCVLLAIAEFFNDSNLLLMCLLISVSLANRYLLPFCSLRKMIQPNMNQIPSIFCAVLLQLYNLFYLIYFLLFYCSFILIVTFVEVELYCYWLIYF